MRLRQDEVSGNWYLEVTTSWRCATFGVIHMHCARSLLEMMKRDEGQHNEAIHSGDGDVGLTRGISEECKEFAKLLITQG